MKINNLTLEQKEELANTYCRSSFGFEGPETFNDCRECLICLCKRFMRRSKK